MRWLTDGCSRQMVSLALIGCFHTKNSHNPNESSVPDVVIHLEIRKQKCRYQDSKVPNQSKLTCLTDELRKDNESPNSAGAMLQANRTKLGKCKSRGNLRSRSLPNLQGVLANSEACGGATAAQPQMKKLIVTLPAANENDGRWWNWSLAQPLFDKLQMISDVPSCTTWAVLLSLSFDVQRNATNPFDLRIYLQIVVKQHWPCDVPFTQKSL